MSSHSAPTGVYDAAIVGAGIAGAATLFHLASAGWRCLLLEREALAGMHSTGRNAAMIRQNVADPVERRLAQKSAAFYAEPIGFDAPLEFRRCGSLLLFGGAIAPHAADPELGAVPLERASRTPDEARALVPLLDGTPFGSAELCASDGVLDVAGLLQGYLGASLRRGAELRLRARVAAVAREPGGVFRLETEAGTFRAARVIDAAGAWCGALGAALGSRVGRVLAPLRRHLFVTAPLAWVEKSWPFTWDEGNGFYFRPESGGLLFCPCDERAAPAGEVAVDAAAEELALEKIARCLPRLLDARFRFRWAGLRTFAPDRRPLVGADPDVEGLLWCGGLGGHGISTAHEVGRLAAGAARGSAEGEDAILLARLAPGRSCTVETGAVRN
ncbi:MAG: FAD-binding oxidoreductase [Planctomycetes bacterium]|nr:FAD-binding oxidoreductase [Planctomycetota bacterium]